MSRYIWMLLPVMLGYASCQMDEEDQVGANGVYAVESVFEPYVQQFIAEAASRGHDIDFNDTGLKIELSDRQLEFAGGFCYLEQHHIVINKSVWLEGFEDYKTRLIFHELGHCELDRGHRNDRFRNKVWKSLMRGDPLSQAERQIPVPFTGFRKKYYIDELFDPMTPDPNWASVDFDVFEVAEQDKQIISRVDSVHRYFQSFESEINAYEIEINFRLNKAAGQSTVLTWSAAADDYSIQFYGENLYLINATKNGVNLFLYRATNSANIDGREVDKVTVHRHGGFEKIFLNDVFIFHIDALPGPLKSVRFESKELQTNNFDLSLAVRSVVISRI